MTGVNIQVGLYLFIIFVYDHNFDAFPFRLVFGSSLIRDEVICSFLPSWWIRKTVIFGFGDESKLLRKRVISLCWIVLVILPIDSVIVDEVTGLIVSSRHLGVLNIRCGNILIGWFMFRVCVVVSGRKWSCELIFFLTFRCMNPVAFCRDQC